MSRRVQREAGPPDDALVVSTAENELSIEDDGDEAPDASSHLREIGKGLRWYDLPFLVLQGLQRSRLYGFAPARWQSAVRNGYNTLYQTHYVRELRRNPRERQWDQIHVPEGESVSLPGVWITEYFTASSVQRLYRKIRTSGWDEPRFQGFDLGGVTTSVLSSRSGGGRTWWRMATLVPRRPGQVDSFEVFRTHLPLGVHDVELIGVSIGKGITAVVAGFRLTPEVSDTLNAVLNAPHRAQVIRRPGVKAIGQGPRPVLHYKLQRARARIHRRLRRWMRRALPGAFARAGDLQPLVDLMFFTVAAPDVDSHDVKQKENDALRGMGVSEPFPYRTYSDDLPGLALDSEQRREWAPEISDNVWALWGNRSAVPNLAKYTGGPSVLGAAFRVGHQSTDFFARSGLTALLRLLRSQASAAHDNARKLHGGTSSRDLKRLRERTLTTSLDLATLEADVRAYNGRRWRDREPAFVMDLDHSLRQREKERDRPQFKPIDVNAEDRRSQRKMARELVEFDAYYREVLSTVASLGTSLDSRRVQRLAVWVSLASLGVAMVTLWVTANPRPDLVQWGTDLIDWVTYLFPQ